MSATEAQAFIEDLRHCVADGGSSVLLGRVDGQPAFLAILTLNRMPNCRHRAELSKGVVHPDYRGKNFVQLGFRALLLRAEQLGIEQLVLDVREGCRAHALWQRFGFVSFGVLEDYARIDGKSHRGHFMVQSVASLRALILPDTHPSTERESNVHV
jgi:ribosomal protein S18 acetylase RimI-like enzyme